MLEHGSVTTGLPGKYRITLALSVALLLHTLVMSALSFTSPEMETHRSTVRVEFVSPGSTTSADASASAATQVPDGQPASRPEIDTLDSPRKQDTAPEEPPQPSPMDQASTESSARPAPARTSTASASGSPEVITRKEPEPITQITRKPQQTDPYLASLAARVGRELDKRPVPSSHRVEEPVTMELELQLMGSGALTRALVTRSTGFREIDKAVHQAALLASPYPEPPNAHSGRKRFRVELIFTPERL